MEQALGDAVAAFGYTLERAHNYDPAKKHGFIDSQKRGMKVFADIDPDAPIIIAEAVLQYSHHLLHGLTTHRGPILTVANWFGTWPGLVGMLNLNGSLTKAGVAYSTLWSDDFTDDYFLTRLEKWLPTGKCTHATRHVTRWSKVKVPAGAKKAGQKLAADLAKNKAMFIKAAMAEAIGIEVALCGTKKNGGSWK